MAQWGNTDDAANSVIWAVTQYDKTANSVNQTAFYGNTTANAFVAGLTVGQYGVDTTEQVVARTSGAHPTHAGWVVKSEGQGGRAGRVQYETLVAMGTITGDGEDTSFPDFLINITSQPANATANSAAGDVATFTVATSTVPAGKTVTFQWEANTGSGFANVANASIYANGTTATLSVFANTATDGTELRVVVSGTGATSVTSDTAVLTVTT